MSHYIIRAFEREDETALVGTYAPEDVVEFPAMCSIARQSSVNNPTLVYSVIANNGELIAFCAGQRVDDGFHVVNENE